MRDEVHVLGTWVHGALTALHALGVVYNARRRNWGDVAMHIGWLVYDAYATGKHMRASSGRD